MSTLAHLLQASYEQVPDRISITLQHSKQVDQPITYSDLIRGGMSCARALHEAKINAGDVVVLILQHGDSLLYAFYGSILYGAIPSIMPFLTEKLAPEKYRHDLAALIAVTKPSAIVTYPEFLEEVKAAVAASPQNPLRAILVSNQIKPVGDVDFKFAKGLDRSPDDIVLLQHSSGTTGLQKGVALSHRAVLNQLQSYSESIRLKDDDVIVSWLPLYHDMGLIAGFVMPIMKRVHLVLMSPFDWVRAPAKLMQAVSKYRGTLSWLPNFAYNFSALRTRERDLEGVDLSSWRAIINCSEPTRYESHQAFLQKFSQYKLKPEALATCYAMAENVFAVTQAGIESTVTVDPIDRLALQSEGIARPLAAADTTVNMLSNGRPIPNCRVKIVDESRNDLLERQLGEVALQSEFMLTGYYHRDDLTQKAFHDGWYLTGDLGYIANGELYVTGRKKDLIIVGGKNVYPQDIEEIASSVDGVHSGRVVAFGIFNDKEGTEDVVMVVEADTDDEDERNRIADDVRQKVTRTSDVALRNVQVVDAKWVLKTSSGKTSRAANRDKYVKEFGG